MNNKANTNEINPLQNYFRKVETYVKLPSSSGDFIEEGTIEYDNDSKELPVYAMTAKDELLFKSPDALLNGEATVKVIKSCVPNIKNPKKLLKNDVDLLLAVIKNVSYDTYDTVVVCPKCQHQDEYSLDVDMIVQSTEMLDDSYPVNLSNGLTLMVSPHIYESTIKAMNVAFQEAKFLTTLNESNFAGNHPAQIEKLSQIMKKITDLNFDLVADSVYRIVDERNNIDVTNKQHIRELLLNISVSDADLIDSEIQRISRIGLINHMEYKCSKCEHEWEAELSFDPVAFFTKS